MKTEAAPQLDLLQALRAVAALMVVMDHSILNLVAKGALDNSKSELAFILASGVYIFFAISGFVMIYTSQNMFGLPGSPSSFFVRRFFRIAPLYWTLTLIVLVRLAASGNLVPPDEILKSFLFIPFLDHDGKFRPVFPLGWTLNYEMFFYVLFSGALFFRKITGIVLIYAAIGGFVICGFIWRPMETAGGFGQIFAFWTDPVMLMFLVGISLGLLRDKLRSLNRLFPLGFNRGFALTLAILCVMIAAVYFGSSAWRAPVLAAGVSLAAAICSIDRNAGAGCLERNNWTVRKLFLHLGTVSYSIYLTHIFLVAICGSLWSRFAQPMLWPFFLLMMILGASVLGHLTYRYVERPLTKYFREHRTILALMNLTRPQKIFPTSL